MKTKKILSSILAGVLAFGAVAQVQPVFGQEILSFGEIAFRHLEYIEENLHHRVGFTQGEKIMADWIIAELERIGFESSAIQIQEFSVDGEMEELVRMILDMDDLTKLPTSQNIILTIPGRSERTIIAGAHKDTVYIAGPGISDNSSGVVLMLEAAEHLFNQDLHYTIQFVFFGAEEQGLIGSRYFVENMTQEERDNLVIMVNADVIFDGETMSFAAGFHDTELNRTGHNNKSRRIIDLAQALDIDLVFEPEGIYAPTDQIAFKDAGFTVAVFYALTTPMLAPADFDLLFELQDQIDAAATANDVEQLNAILQSLQINNPALYNALSTQINVRIDAIENPQTLPETPLEDDESEEEAVQMGLVLHSPNDNLAFLEENHPGLVIRALRTYGLFLNEILTLNEHDVLGIQRINQGGIYFVPFRAAVNYLGFGDNILWNEATGEITLQVAGRQVLISIGNTSIIKNVNSATQTFELIQAPVVIDGRTYLPQEFFETVLNVQMVFN